LALSSYPILRIPDSKRKNVLYADASGFAIGCIFAQIDQSGIEYICGYYSRILTKQDIKYGITEKECLAVICGIKYFRVYLQGSVFLVITDHAALIWLKNLKNPSGRLTRWSIFIQEFDFEIIHRKGKNHGNVDAISRPVLNYIVDIAAISQEPASNGEPWADQTYIEFPQISKNSTRSVE